MKPINLAMSGTYELIVRNKEGKITKRSPVFKNMITNIGFDRFLQTLDFFTYAFCGTGSAAPAATDVTMQAFLAETNTRVADTTETTYVAPRWFVQKGTFTFNVGAVVGNVAEVGIGWKPSGSVRSTFSRSLVVDSGGTPTTITVLADEQLTIIYRLYVKVQDNDTTFTVNDGAASYNVTVRQSWIAANTSMIEFLSGFYGASGRQNYADAKETDVLPSITTGWVIGASANNSSTYVVNPYTVGSFEASLTATFPGDKANYATGIGSMMFSPRNGTGVWMVGFSPKIPKATGQTLTMTFKYALSRGTPP